ncbi:MAG: chloride channel protein [Pseudomonadota bacterium]|nr:chloride channel protein [Pseudomonadota bacterium]
MFSRIGNRIEALRTRLRLHLSSLESTGQLALLGALVGILSAVVIILFRELIDTVQTHFLPAGNAENYEALTLLQQFLLPAIGGLVVGLLFQAVPSRYRQVGVVHVMDRLDHYQGHLPLLNGVMQFIGGAASIIFGHSVGREGPAIHLGATSGSSLGRFLSLPNSSTRTLVACGVAAAIGASFNTPLAGVILAMEVVLMEYTLASFIPLILAAVSSTAVSRLFYGDTPVFTVPPVALESLFELPYILIAGLLLGALAALFIYLLQYFSSVAKQRPIWMRMTLAGCAVGLCAVVMPAVMGIGYDTVDSAIAGQIGIALLFAIIIFKILATTAGLGLGLPGGLIGPTLVIGACAGAAFGELGELVVPAGMSSPPALYALIGMVAMMGATLSAPLAALIALLELTSSAQIIFPGMLAVVGATLVSGQLFGKEPIFILLMRTRGLGYREDLRAQALRRSSVMRAVDRAVVSVLPKLSREEASQLLQQRPRWLLVTLDEKHRFALPAADLAYALKADDQPLIDLESIPAQRRDSGDIDMRSSLQEAIEMMDAGDMESLCVINHRTTPPQLFGLLTRAGIEEYYRQPGATLK